MTFEFDPLYSLSEESAAHYAEEWLKNPLRKAIFIELRNGCIETWLRSTNRDQREACWSQIIALGAVEKQLENRIDALKIELASRAKKRANAA